MPAPWPTERVTTLEPPPAPGAPPSPSDPAPAGPAPRTRPGWAGSLGAGALMAAAAGLLVAAMFPPYPGNPATPVIDTPYQTAVYICLEVGWALAALVVLTRLSVRGGVALGAALGAVEVGLLVTDMAGGFLVSDGAAAGIWLATAGLAAGLAGVLYGASSLPSGSERRSAREVGGTTWRVGGFSAVRPLLSVVAAVAAVGGLWPSWDHYHVVYTSGQVTNLDLGNVFDQPSAVMAGEVLAGLALGVAIIVAGLWRDARVGAWAMTGAAIALVSQVASGAVQASEPVSKLLGGASAAGVDLSATRVSLTGYWYLDLGAAAALGLLALWGALEGHRGRTQATGLAAPHAPEEWPAERSWPN